LSTPRHSILGVHINATDYTKATDAIVDAAKRKRTFGASAMAVHGVMTGVTSAVHRGRLNSLEYLVPDGQPVRWALNWIHKAKLNDRVYGPFLTKAVCARAEQEGLRVFFYGSDEATLAALRENLARLYPNLIIAGM
jgi:UDP-N-acetyl-D-mannosaminuronic acid transferase (WecB/TagA/CpsF family)